jgi:hypothetical protein
MGCKDDIMKPVTNRNLWRASAVRILKIIRAIREERKRNRAYCQMTAEDLARLSNEELSEALSARILNEEGDRYVDECLKEFEGAKRIFYIVNYFDMEIQNGGLCQFFVNPSRLVAPYVLECLTQINAVSYKELFEGFVINNKISLDDLDSFIIDDVNQFEIQRSRYPFDKFDNSYYELYENEPLQELLVKYAREHIGDFTTKK